MKRVYIASKAKHYLRWQGLVISGVNISSSWIYRAYNIEDWEAHWQACVDDVRGSDAVLAYHEATETPKGALVEIGVALALKISVVSVGFPFEHTWQLAPGVIATDTLQAAFNLIQPDRNREIDFIPE